jgi:hypothetical protein
MPLPLKLITLLMLPITLSSCAKAQGALAPTGDKYEGYGAYLPDQNRQPSDAFLPADSFAQMRAELHPKICSSLFGSSI